MYGAAKMGKGQRIGLFMAVAGLAVLAVVPTAAVAGGGGEQAQREPEAHERARAEIRALFDHDAGGGYIGVKVRDVEDGAGTAGAEEGAVVTEVVDGAPAAVAGIQAGDVVVELDGERVRSVRQLTRLVQETPAGRAVAATVLRNEGRITVTVTPSGRPRPGWTARLPRVEIPEPDAPMVWRGDLAVLEELPDIVNGAVMSLVGQARLGIRGEAVDGQLAHYFGVSAGVLVRHVEEGTVASAAGLRAGDVITAIDSEAVDSPRALRRRLSALDPGASFAIAIMRDGAAMSLPAELAEEAERRPRGSRRGTGI